MDIGILSGKCDKILGGNPGMDYHHIQEGVSMHKVTSWYLNREKLWMDCPSGSEAFQGFNSLTPKN